MLARLEIYVFIYRGFLPLLPFLGGKYPILFLGDLTLNECLAFCCTVTSSTYSVLYEWPLLGMFTEFLGLVYSLKLPLVFVVYALAPRTGWYIEYLVFTTGFLVEAESGVLELRIILFWSSIAR